MSVLLTSRAYFCSIYVQYSLGKTFREFFVIFAKTKNNTNTGRYIFINVKKLFYAELEMIRVLALLYSCPFTRGVVRVSVRYR
jgi:hypothetical protein